VQQVKMCHTTKKAQITKRRIQKCTNQKNRERPEQRKTGPDRNHGRDLGPEPNRPREGGGQGDQPRVQAHPGAGAPWCGRTPRGSKPGPSFSGSCMPPCIGRFHLLPYFDAMNCHSSTIKREALPPFQHTYHLESIYLTPLTCIFSLD